jgi:hypothetical protein
MAPALMAKKRTASKIQARKREPKVLQKKPKIRGYWGVFNEKSSKTLRRIADFLSNLTF